MEPPIPKRALVIRFPGSEKLKVGGLDPASRWARLLAQEKIESRSLVPEELQGALTGTDGAVLLAFGGHALDPLVVEAIVERARGCAKNELIVACSSRLDGPAPLMGLGPEVARAICGSFSLDMFESPRALLDAAGRVRPGSSATPIDFERSFWGPVRNEAEARKATWELLRLLRWRPGGLVAKYLNRPISLRITRGLINTRIRPNHVTVFDFLIGVCGVAFIFWGDRPGLVAGAALLQLNSIIDGVDGELARMRCESSELGAFLDSISDEVVSAGMFVAVGRHLAVHGGFPALFWAGLLAGSVSLLYAVIHWHCRLRHGLGFYWWFEAYKPRKGVQRRNDAWSYFKKLFWKESTHFLVLALAIAGCLEAFLAGAAMGAAAVAVMLIIHVLVKRARW